MKSILWKCVTYFILNMLVIASTETVSPEDTLQEKNGSEAVSKMPETIIETTIIPDITNEKSMNDSVNSTEIIPNNDHYNNSIPSSVNSVEGNFSQIQLRSKTIDNTENYRINDEEETAYVEEVPDPSALYAENHQSSSKIAGLFGEKPFYLERDPITGAIDFNLRTVKIGDLSHSFTSKFDVGSSEDEYYSDEDTGDGIDRKDVNVKGMLRPNDIIPYKNFPSTVNDFSNINVHDYSNHKYSNEKFPIISSSYANTKVQGSIGNTNKKYRPSFTSSTPPPFYYSMYTEGSQRIGSSSTTTAAAMLNLPVTTGSSSASDSEEYDEIDDDVNVDDVDDSKQITNQEESHQQKGGVTDLSKVTPTDISQWESHHENIPDTSQHDLEYEDTDFEDEDYEDDLSSAANVDLKKQKDPPPVSENTNEKEKPFRFTTTPKYQQHSTHPTTMNNKIQPLGNTKHETINYVSFSEATTHRSTTADYKESTTAKINQVVTSMPLGTHFQYRPPLQMQTLPRQPETKDQNPKKQESSSNPALKQNGSDLKTNENYSTNIVLGTDIRHQDVAGSFTVGNTSSSLDKPTNTISQLKPNVFPDEPFRPIFGPDKLRKDTYPSRPDTLQVQTTKLIVPSKIPTLNYSNKDDSSTFSVNNHKITTVPPKVIGVEPPRLDSSLSFLKSPAVDPYVIKGASHYSSSVIPTDSSHSPKYPTFNMDQFVQRPTPQSPLVQNVHVSSHVVFPDDQPHQGTVLSENLLSLNRQDQNNFDKTEIHNTAVHQTINVEDVQGFQQSSHSGSPQHKPLKVRDDNLAPLQHLTPPAQSEQNRPQLANNRPRPNWDSRPRPPPTKFFSPGNQQHNARPKIDNVKPNFIQGTHSYPGNQVHSNANHGRPNIPHADLNLPNILPQFRPNAKVSYTHNDRGSVMQSNHRRQSLERPINRHPVGLAESLRPPPPPPHLRINRNDDSLQDSDLEEPVPFEKFPPLPPTPPVIQRHPLVRRRTGIHAANAGETNHLPVTTLQMIQQNGNPMQYLSRPYQVKDSITETGDLKSSIGMKTPLSKTEENNEKQPVYVVYPVNTASVNTIQSSIDSSDVGGVVVGTRGSQLPLPPDDLDSDINISPGDDEEMLAFTRNKDQVPILQVAKDKHYSLTFSNSLKKSNYTEEKSTNSDFPYPIIPPEDPLEKGGGKIESHNDNVNDEINVQNLRNDFIKLFTKPIDKNIEAEVHNSKISDNDEDSEINIIPYLQDYMPYATKKPHLMLKQADKGNVVKDHMKPTIFQWPLLSNSKSDENKTIYPLEQNENSSLSPISVTLKTVPLQTTSIPSKVSDFTKPFTSNTAVNPNLPPSRQQAIVGSSGSEFTLSASMHAHSQQQQSNHRPSNPEALPSPSSLPLQQHFQVPFLASANIDSAPLNQGWTVVGLNNERLRYGVVDRDDTADENSDTSTKNENTQSSSDPSNFDFENFKPELIGGFKPIYTFPTESDNSSSEDSRRGQVIPTDREEKKLKT